MNDPSQSDRRTRTRPGRRIQSFAGAAWVCLSALLFACAQAPPVPNRLNPVGAHGDFLSPEIFRLIDRVVDVERERHIAVQ